MKVFVLFLSLSFFSHSQTDTYLIYVPNVLSEVCDVSEGVISYQLVVKYNCTPENYTLSIFNRWGEFVFQSNNINESWFASEQKTGVYIYHIKANYYNSDTITQTGSVALIR